MPSDLCSDDVVVCITAPQILMSESIVTSGAGAGAGAGARATSTATVELGRRLLLAARAGDTPLVLDLMARGAPFTTDWLGTSPLHLAAGNAHADTCAVLLRAGFSRDARTKVQRTPLHLAAYGGHAHVAALLLEAGAALECRDMLRMTPLHWAVQRGHARAAHELLRRGADPHALSKFHKSPASIAAELRRDDILKLIDDCVREREAARSVHALVHEQMEDAPALEPQIQILDTVQRLEQVKPRHFEKKLKLDITHTDAGNMRRDDLLKLIEDAMQERGGRAGAAAAGEPAHYTVVDEQMSESPDAPQLQAFDTIHRIQEVKIKKTKDRNTKMDTERSASGGSGSSAAAAAQLLRAHGITLLPADTGSTVLSALQSGRTVVLSDAGKLMLKESGEHPATSKSSAGAPSSQAQAAGAGAAQGRAAAQGKGQGVLLTATPVTSPPRPGVKIFTLNNKLLAPKDGHKIPVKKIINSHDMQVKFVHLPADAKIVSPSKLVPLKARAKLAASPAGAGAVKIIMNKTNFTKLMANTTKPGVLHNGIEASPTSSTAESAPAAAAESHVEADNVVCVPEEFLRSTSPRYLRAQLLAAHQALAALRADLHACKARLQHYERV